MLLKKSQIRKIVLWGVMAGLLGISPSVWAIKPQPPLQLHLATTDLSNGRIELKLHATAFMAIPSAEILLHLPESVSLLEGKTKWAGPMTLGEEKTFTLLLQAVSTIPSAVLAEGTVALPQGGSFTQHATLTINPEPYLSPPPPMRRKQGKGTILEFPGK